MTNHKKNLNVLEALADAAVTVELEEGVSTKESRAAADRYHAFITDRLAEMRRAELAHIEPKIEKRPIRASLQAMAHDALLAEVARLRRAHPNLKIAFRKLSKVTDDDLRTMIEDIYWSVEHAS